MSVEDLVTGPGSPPASGPVGLVTQSPLSFALVLVGLYWVHKFIRGIDVSRPPRAPYWIPWVGNAIDMGKDPDGFFSNMTKIHGPIFRVKTLGQEMIFVTSPSLISQVYRNSQVCGRCDLRLTHSLKYSQSFDFLAVRVEMGRDVFTIRDEIGASPYMLDTYMHSLHHALLPTTIGPMVSTFLTSVHDTLLGVISSMDGASGPLKTFIVPPAYRAGAHAAFGPDFPAEKTWKAFQMFDESLPMLSAGLPKFILRKPLKAWDEIIDVIEEYLVDNEDHLEDLGPFVQVGIDGRRDNWMSRDIATVLAVQLWAIEANVMWATYWLIAELLQQPEGLLPLVAELDDVRKQWQAEHPSTPLGPAFFNEVIVSSPERVPLLTSAIQEILRYRSSVFSMRRVTTAVTLGGYQLRLGEKVICATRQVHLDDEIHPGAEEFDIRRYLDPPRPLRDGKLVPNHSMPFGGGVSMHMAMIELRLFIAILLTYGSLEIDEGCTTRPEVLRGRMGLGIMHAKGDMDVILRKRKL
ncbi:cytochrome P450 [Ganoderma sinense ZZ0214-1]|uniref:Cytochrome P450 n=1 Tax=Ganoderma sinense ZZ0214-1 TaxID=1077348 RepID=A0A2G8SDK0_9APHY|nr:cytochrome P450 [Ganoderma sinense ZZ0214-1]